MDAAMAHVKHRQIITAVAHVKQRQAMDKDQNILQLAPDYTQPLFQVMDAALAHVKERQSTELILCSYMQSL